MPLVCVATTVNALVANRRQAPLFKSAADLLRAPQFTEPLIDKGTGFTAIRGPLSQARMRACDNGPRIAVKPVPLSMSGSVNCGALSRSAADLNSGACLRLATRAFTVVATQTSGMVAFRLQISGLRQTSGFHPLPIGHDQTN